jgi:hypothetical protein
LASLHSVSKEKSDLEGRVLLQCWKPVSDLMAVADRVVAAARGPIMNRADDLKPEHVRINPRQGVSFGDGWRCVLGHEDHLASPSSGAR